MGNLRKGRKRKPKAPQEQQKHLTPPTPPSDPRGVFEGAEPEDGSHPAMTQCERCHKVITGPHNGFNPGHRVQVGSARGVYRDSAEATAAGENLDDCRGFSHALCQQHQAEYNQLRDEVNAIEDEQERKQARRNLVYWQFGEEPPAS